MTGTFSGIRFPPHVIARLSHSWESASYDTRCVCVYICVYFKSVSMFAFVRYV